MRIEIASSTDQRGQQAEQTSAALGVRFLVLPPGTEDPRRGTLRIAILVVRRGACRLRRSAPPHALHELDAVVLEDALHAADRITLAVEQMANAAQQIDIVGTIIASAAAALHRLDL